MNIGRVLSVSFENIMQINALKLANAAALTVGILYVLCTLFVALAPDSAMSIFRGGMHMPDIGTALGGVQVTTGGFLLGLIPMLIYSYIGAYLLATLYNRSVR